VNDDESVVKNITLINYQELKQEGVISDGMLPKLENAFDALHYGVEKVIIEHALHINGTLKTEICLR
jgi:acetylglutamate kinase